MNLKMYLVHNIYFKGEQTMINIGIVEDFNKI